MKYFGKAVVRSRFLILIIAALLLVPSVIGYLNTRINYDVLTYLPKDIETMKGQDILLDEFGQGAISMMAVEGMDFKDVSKLKAEIGEVPHRDAPAGCAGCVHPRRRDAHGDHV